MDRTALGKRLNTARKECGLTSERLAELCDINATYLRQIEAGTKVPSLPVFVSICEAMKVSPNYLLSDSLAENEYSDLEELMPLIQSASPGQLKLISAMLRAALQAIDA